MGISWFRWRSNHCEGGGGGEGEVGEGEEERERDDSKKGGRAVEKEAVPWALMTRTQHATHYL